MRGELPVKKIIYYAVRESAWSLQIRWSLSLCISAGYEVVIRTQNKKAEFLLILYVFTYVCASILIDFGLKPCKLVPSRKVDIFYCYEYI